LSSLPPDWGMCCCVVAVGSAVAMDSRGFRFVVAARTTILVGSPNPPWSFRGGHKRVRSAFVSLMSTSQKPQGGLREHVSLVAILAVSRACTSHVCGTCLREVCSGSSDDDFGGPGRFHMPLSGVRGPPRTLLGASGAATQGGERVCEPYADVPEASGRATRACKSCGHSGRFEGVHIACLRHLLA
jgi:hypothetical protein